MDLYRRERGHRQQEPADELDIEGLPASFEAMWEAWAVCSSLDDLPTEEWDVMRATHYLDMTHREAADHLEIPLGTVRARSHQAHRRLADALAYVRGEMA